jgi:hypothetical protein
MRFYINTDTRTSAMMNKAPVGRMELDALIFGAAARVGLEIEGEAATGGEATGGASGGGAAGGAIPKSE